MCKVIFYKAIMTRCRDSRENTHTRTRTHTHTHTHTHTDWVSSRKTASGSLFKSPTQPSRRDEGNKLQSMLTHFIDECTHTNTNNKTFFFFFRLSICYCWSLIRRFRPAQLFSAVSARLFANTHHTQHPSQHPGNNLLHIPGSSEFSLWTTFVVTFVKKEEVKTRLLLSSGE